MSGSAPTALPLLSLILAAPWAGALVLVLLPRGLGDRRFRRLSVAFSLSTLALGLRALVGFDPHAHGMQFSELHPWIPSLGARYHLGLDGLSLVLVLLTGVLAPMGLLAPRSRDSDPRLFGALFLLLQGSALGVFLCLDFVPWFVFWELSLVPAFFLIRLWGGAGAARAATQFMVMTAGGSALLLLGFVAIRVATGTFDFTELARLASDGTLAHALAGLGRPWPRLVFAGVFLGLAVKAPLFPFHTWLPATYAEAPTGVSLFLTGVVSKMGVYGFLRILWPLFPGPLHAAAQPLLLLALGSIVFGAFAALRQRDLKRMAAYSSLNHTGYCLLALFAVCAALRPGVAGSGAGTLATAAGAGPDTAAAISAALAGAILQVVNHGLSAAALFFCLGILEDRSGGLRGFYDFGGLRKSAPLYAGICGITLFSSLGLPGLNGFVGEFLIFRGTFALVPWAAAAACLGLFVTALFLLTFWQEVFHGPPRGAGAGFRDLTARETAALVPSLALMLILGVAPQVCTGLFNPLVAAWASGRLCP